jgi:predicted RNase H-like nuclease
VTVAGVDGCRQGWVVAVADAEHSLIVDLFDAPSFEDVVALLDCGVTNIAVDMPIGLPESGPRACDIAARQLLGPRRTTVFPAPPRPILHERDYQTALAHKRTIDGTGLSKQSFHLLPKIAEIDAAISPAIQHRIVECHPELAFQRRHGRPLASKHEAQGLEQRRALMGDLLDDQPIPRLRGTAAHDVLDAMALTFTARALLHDDAERLGDGALDARGLVMEIVW